jgi:anti-anti-sigma regulatory factor
MKRRSEIVINLSDIYSNSISSRSSITVLLDKHRNQSDLDIVFNFDRIQFCSRSAAQQIVSEKKTFSKNNVTFSYRNVPFDVNKILELAEHKLTRKKLDIKEKEISSQEEFESFLLSY